MLLELFRLCGLIADYDPDALELGLDDVPEMLDLIPNVSTLPYPQRKFS